MDTDIIALAKSDARQRSKQFWLAEIEKRAVATRKPGQSKEQSFSKVCETPEGLALFRASQAAYYEQPEEFTDIQKGYAEHVGTTDSATERLSRLVLAVQKAQPYRDPDTIIEEVLSKNPEMAALMRAENNLQPIEKGAGSPLKRYGRIADNLVRTGVADNQRHAATILQDSHPGLVSAAQREGARRAAEENANWDDAEAVGKRGVINRTGGAVKSDAMNRLVNVASGLMGSGYSADSAWARARQANPEYARLAQADDGLPADLIDLTPSESNYRPRTETVTQDVNRSGNPPNVGKRDWKSGEVRFQKA
jgi:hypothetical protein